MSDEALTQARAGLAEKRAARAAQVAAAEAADAADAATRGADGLTERQRAFCRHVVAGASGAEAAREAGYAPGSARFQASRLMANDNIAQHLAELRGAEEARVKALKARMEVAVDNVLVEALADEAPAQRGVVLRAVALRARLGGLFDRAPRGGSGPSGGGGSGGGGSGGGGSDCGNDRRAAPAAPQSGLRPDSPPSTMGGMERRSSSPS